MKGALQGGGGDWWELPVYSGLKAQPALLKNPPFLTQLFLPADKWLKCVCGGEGGCLNSRVPVSSYSCLCKMVKL